ncbi:MAG: heparin lyase I family protein [Solirubrobacterales bacterium]
MAPFAAATLALILMLTGILVTAPADAVAKDQTNAGKSQSRKADRRATARHHRRNHTKVRTVSVRAKKADAPVQPAQVGPSTPVSPANPVRTQTPTPAATSPAPTPTTPAVPTSPASPPTTVPTEPTPTPESTKTSLFSSDFSRGLQNWSLAGVGEATPQVVDGPEGPYCEFTLNGSQGRSELIMGDDLHVTEGQTVLYEFEEFIVPGFAYGSRALGWNLFTQFKSDGEGSPMLALDLWNEEGKKGLWVEPEPGPNYFVAPMEEGVWHRISMQITASGSGQGGWILYLDGQEVDRKSGMDTIRPGKAFAYIKNGLYRSGPTINANSRLRLRNVSLAMVS